MQGSLPRHCCHVMSVPCSVKHLLLMPLQHAAEHTHTNQRSTCTAAQARRDTLHHTASTVPA